MNSQPSTKKRSTASSGNFTVKVGHITIPVYHHPPTAKRKHESYTVSVFLHGHRIRGHFAKKPKAIAFAELQAAKIKAGEAFATKLNPAQAASFFRAIEHIRQYGKPIELVCAEWAEIKKILGDRNPIEAARLFAKINADHIRKPIPILVTDLTTQLEADGASAVYVRDLKHRLERFAGQFTGDLTDLTGPEIDTWLRALKIMKDDSDAPRSISPRSRNNFRRAVQTLINFAKGQNHIPRDLDLMASIKVAKESANKIDIFNVDEITLLLIKSSDRMLPFIAIGAFAGLRSAEIGRLKWEDVQWDSGHIVVNASIAKTGQRRLVPFQDNLKAWLLPYRDQKGLVCDIGNISRTIIITAKNAGVPWRHNALRHSYISYRVAAVQNVAQVALEAGNSPRMIFNNYREVVSPAEAARFFDIMPPKKTTIVRLTKSA